jgi:hypothetical protein
VGKWLALLWQCYLKLILLFFLFSQKEPKSIAKFDFTFWVNPDLSKQSKKFRISATLNFDIWI